MGMLADPRNLNEMKPPSWRTLLICVFILLFGALSFTFAFFAVKVTPIYLVASVFSFLITTTLIRMLVFHLRQESKELPKNLRCPDLVRDRLGNEIDPDPERFYICPNCGKKNIILYDCSQCRRRYWNG